MLLGCDRIIVIITGHRKTLIISDVNGLMLLVHFVLGILYFDLVFHLVIYKSVWCHDAIYVLHTWSSVAISFVEDAVSVLVVAHRTSLH